MIHNKIHFDFYGGFPFDQQTLQFLQNTYNGVADVVKNLIGDKVIVSGVVELNNGEFSDGWIVYDGLLVPFIGGVSHNRNFSIVESVESLRFEDTQLKPVILKRYALPTEDGISISILKRLNDFTSLTTKVENLAEHYEKNIITCYYDLEFGERTSSFSGFTTSPRDDYSSDEYSFGRKYGAISDYVVVKCDNNEIPSTHWELRIIPKTDNTKDLVAIDVWRHRTMNTRRFDGTNWIEEKLTTDLEGEIKTRLWFLLVRKNFTVPLFGNSLTPVFG